MNVAEFLKATITTPEGYLCMALRAPNVVWHEVFFKWPEEVDKAMELAYQHRDEYDVYFSSYLFRTPNSSSKDNVLPSRTIQADLDAADIRTLPLEPGMLVKTSPGRYQAYWFLDKFNEADLELHELLSRRLTYAITDADKSGWSLGHKVRVVDTYNHKYLEGKHLVEVMTFDPRMYSISELELLPEVDTITLDRFDSEFIDKPPSDPKEHALGPNELLETIKSKISLQIYTGYNQTAQDRSAALWALMCNAFRAGLGRKDVFWLALHSANNKFARLHYHADRDLAKDVLRAENSVFTQRTDPRSIVADFRKQTALSGAERKRAILGFVFSHMKEEGDFIKTPTKEAFYIPRDTGHPVQLTSRNEHFDSLLDMRYGLNRTEDDHQFTVFGVLNQMTAQNSNGVQASLSYFDSSSHVLYLHTGRKDVIIFKPKQAPEIVTDGTRGVVFPWDIHAPFNPLAPTAVDQGKIDWGLYLFGDLKNVVDLSPDEARLLLKIWFLFILFRDAAQARPILALLGQPGCIGELCPLQIQRQHDIYTLSIAELYRKMHGGVSYTRKWNPEIPTKILSLKDGAIQYRTIHDVVKSGVKKTYNVVVNSNVIRTTAEHRFLTPSGYKQLSELNPGDLVYTRSLQTVRTDKRVQNVRRKVSARYHPNAQSSYVGGKNYPRIYHSKAVYEAAMNDMTVEQFLHILNHDAEIAATLTYLDKSLNVHHKDENYKNDALDNLEAIPHASHAKHHGDAAKHHFGNFAPMLTRITSIEEYGEEETYDIIMEDQEAPNFLANGVIVHNSGKTSIGHRIHAMLYGSYANVLGVTSSVNYDQSTATKPLVMLDNVDTWEPWLPDRLAQSAAVIDFDKRKLYSDIDTIRVRRQAMVALTAHNPKFSREDITDRLLIINLLRLPKFEPEGPMIDAIKNLRNKLWYSVVQDIQAILNNPLLPTTNIKFRIADFARIGEWISLGLNQHEEFLEIMRKMTSSQVTHNLQTDQILVGSIVKYAKNGGSKGGYKNQQELFSILQSLCTTADAATFQRTYKNQLILGKKIWVLLDSLQTLVQMEFQEGSAGARLWKIGDLKNGWEEKHTG